MLPDRRSVLRSLAIFAVVFVMLNLPARGLGHAIASAASDLGNAAIGGYAFGPDLELRFTPPSPDRASTASSVDLAWTISLRAQRSPSGAHYAIAINVRKMLWVPFAVLLALVVASPIWPGARGWVVLAIGTLAVQVPMLLLATIHATAMLYERYVVDLSSEAQTAIRFVYALLAPPGMVYALPLMLWAALMFATRPLAKR